MSGLEPVVLFRWNVVRGDRLGDMPLCQAETHAPYAFPELVACAAKVLALRRRDGLLPQAFLRLGARSAGRRAARHLPCGHFQVAAVLARRRHRGSDAAWRVVRRKLRFTAIRFDLRPGPSGAGEGRGQLELMVSQEAPRP